MLFLSNVAYADILVPYPNKIEFKDGEYIVQRNISLCFPDSCRSEVNDLVEFFESKKIGFCEKEDDAIIHLRIDKNYSKMNESYSLVINKDKINIIASDRAGIFYGIQTLKQLLKKNNEGNYFFPYVEIEDAPRFEWRALLLDEARTFQGKYLVKRGCQHVGGIFKFDDMQGPGRYNGLLTALFEAGVDVDESKFCWYGTEERKKVMDDGDDYNGYLKGFLDRMVEEKAIDGLVCYNDEISPYAVRHLISIGARMPEDIKLTSFDNSFYSQIGPLTVTSIGHGKIRMGIEAANMLLEIMEGKEPPSRKIRWELNQRASS